MQVGDTVVLKSGGPVMTIGSVNSSKKFVCYWFAEKEKREGEFPPATLIDAHPETSAADAATRRHSS